MVQKRRNSFLATNSTKFTTVFWRLRTSTLTTPQHQFHLKDVGAFTVLDFLKQFFARFITTTQLVSWDLILFEPSELASIISKEWPRDVGSASTCAPAANGEQCCGQAGRTCN